MPTTWFGYDAPQGLIDGMDNGYAERGAGSLDSFQDALRATHVGSPSHNTGVPKADAHDHVYATVAAGDFISVTAGVNGPDPTGLSFGATTFTSTPHSVPIIGVDVTGGVHGSYWDDKNAALRNLGFVISGQGD